jgi:MFS family permease
LQNLIWGLGQPFAGAIADKYGAPRVLSAGIILYALGLISPRSRRHRASRTSRPAC